MKPLNLNFLSMLSFLVPIFLVHQVVTANTCLSDAGQSLADELLTLPKTIGNPKATIAKTPYQMDCDTMYVKAGDTTTVYQGSLLHFPPNQFQNRIIRVQGTLLLLGDKGLPVFMAGSKKENPVGSIPGEEKWGGIRLDSGGSLLARHTDFVNADTVFYLRSKRFAFEEAYFSKCGVYVLSDKSLKILDDNETLTIPDTAGIFLPKKLQKSFSKAPWIWSGAGVAAVGVVGAVLILNSKEDGGSTPKPKPNESALKPAPDFGAKPDPR